MSLGMEVGLGPSQIVLGGGPAPPPLKGGHSTPPILRVEVEKFEIGRRVQLTL